MNQGFIAIAQSGQATLAFLGYRRLLAAGKKTHAGYEESELGIGFVDGFEFAPRNQELRSAQ